MNSLTLSSSPALQVEPAINATHALVRNAAKADIEILQVLESSYSNHNTVCICRMAGEVVVYKFFSVRRTNEYSNEVLALRLFTDMGMPVPRILDTGFVHNQAGETLGYIAMTHIEGASLKDTIDSLSEVQLPQIGEQILALLKKQQDATLLNFDAKAECLLAGKFRNLTSKVGFKELKAIGIDSALIDECVAKASKLTNPLRLSQVTHDWRLRHVFIEDGNVSGILDLEYVKHNDFAMEIGHLLHDILLHDTPNARYLGAHILRHITSFSANDNVFIERLPLCMTKQAISHMLARAADGFDLNDLLDEAYLAVSYINMDARQLLVLFTNTGGLNGN